MKPLVVAIHGILTGRTVASWPDRFAEWCEQHGVDARIERKEYFAGPFPTWNVLVKNRILAKGLAAEVELWGAEDRRPDAHGMTDIDQALSSAPKIARRRICFVAHSNGTDIALKAVKRLAARGIATDTIILVGSVVQPDVARNGIRELLVTKMLRRAVAYWSPSDSAIGIAGRLPWCAYKDLGKRGWMWRGAQAGQLYDMGLYSLEFTAYDHGTYFDSTHSDSTFSYFRKDLEL